MSELLVAGMAYLDIFVPPSAPPAPGTEVFVDAIALRFGGAVNSASVAAALGLRVSLAAPVGAGLADLALGALAARLGITLHGWGAPDNPAVSLVYASAGERAFLSSAAYAALDRVARLPQAAWIHVPGLEEAARLAAPLAAARREGAKVCVSGSWAPQRLAALAQLDGTPWDVLVLNEKEAEAACGSVPQAAVRLAGAARALVVTCGAAGASGYFGAAPLHVAAAPAEPLDATGAGDAFCAGLLAALSRGAAPEPALRLATAAAARMMNQRGGVLEEPSRIAAMAGEMQ
ncbi:carbohydrate kinase family protein [Massilia sp. CCM 9210]|uniref:carbohydrate kinase family protein n=1 Tax=Massilia scottii TaxID=3057166 RepID=UPI002796CF86|nr:carbohydrate kinase family protein [Massilia sp. CCM 9210]MDQ1816955.1 carbohydrate kinase family protein [Massilia sp. CCM 9210]